MSVIFERSRWLGEVSEDWKKANVTFIFKKGKKEDPGLVSSQQSLGRSYIYDRQEGDCVQPA